MKFILKLLPLVFLGVIVYSCCKDDEELPQPVPRDRTEQYEIDKTSIKTFLETHYISDVAPTSDYLAFDHEVFIKPIPVPNTSNEVSMWDDPRRRTVFLKNDLRDFSVSPPSLINDAVDYEVHYFDLNADEAPAINAIGGLPIDFDYKNHAHVTDSVFVNYKGTKIRDLQVFDKAYLPVWFNLNNVLSGFRQIMPYIKMGEFDSSSSSPSPFNNIGSVLVVIPSGLGYFSSSAGSGILPFENLIFQINGLRVKRTDWDNDGIINLFEGELDYDAVTNIYTPKFFVPKTFSIVNFNGVQQSITQNMVFDLWGVNSDNDNFANFIDNDDDGDGTLTRREIRKKYDGSNCSLPKWYDINGVFQNQYHLIPDNQQTNSQGLPFRVHLNSATKYNNITNGVETPQKNHPDSCWPSN